MFLEHLVQDHMEVVWNGMQLQGITLILLKIIFYNLAFIYYEINMNNISNDTD